jgi:hypothetical protein
MTHAIGSICGLCVVVTSAEGVANLMKCEFREACDWLHENIGRGRWVFIRHTTGLLVPDERSRFHIMMRWR